MLVLPWNSLEDFLHCASKAILSKDSYLVGVIDPGSMAPAVAMTALVLLGLGQLVAADICPDDVDSDLCYTADEYSSGQRMAPNLNLLLLLLALALPRSTLKHAALSMAALFSLPGAAAATCGDLKTFYKSQQCCGSASKSLTAQVPGCPYNFNPPACSTAEPQTPRDLSTGAQGSMTPKAATLTDAQANFLPLVNVHFHYGAEHKSDSYMNGTLSEAYDAQNAGRRLASNPRPGWMCASDTLTSAQMTPYTFQYCQGVEVGQSYEVHYVHSSAGVDADATDGVNADDLADGLGGMPFRSLYRNKGQVCSQTCGNKPQKTLTEEV